MIEPLILSEPIVKDPVCGDAVHVVINCTVITQSKGPIVAGTLEGCPKAYFMSMTNLRARVVGLESLTLLLQGADNHQLCGGKMHELFAQQSKGNSL